MLRLYDALGSTTPVIGRLVREGFCVKTPASVIYSSAAIEMSILDKGKEYAVYLPFYNSPVDFWLQIVDNSEALDELNAQIEAIQGQLTSIPSDSLKPGTPCISYATEFGCYYRAVVSSINAETQKCMVTYVDYGNTEEKPNNELFVLEPKFTSLPSQGIPCCLYGAKCKPGDFDHYMNSETLRANVVQVTHSGLHIVQLYEEGKRPVKVQHPRHASGMRQAHATPVENHQEPAVTVRFKPVHFDMAADVAIVISHVEESGLFYAQLLTNATQLDELMCSLQRSYQQARPVTPGQICEGCPVVVQSTGGNNVFYRLIEFY